MPEEDLFELCALTADDFANVDMGEDERVVPAAAPQRTAPALSSTAAAAGDSAPAESWAAEQRTQNEEVVLLSTGSSCLPEANGALSDEQRLLHRVERCVLETNAEELETISSTATEAATAAALARKQALQTAQTLVKGDFEQLLSSCAAFAEAAPHICSTLQDVAALISSRVQSYIAGEAAVEAQAWRRAELNWLGAAALNLFLQCIYVNFPNMVAARVCEM